MFSPPLPHSNLPILFLAAKVSENPTNDDQTCATHVHSSCHPTAPFPLFLWVPFGWLTYNYECRLLPLCNGLTGCAWLRGALLWF